MAQGGGDGEIQGTRQINQPARFGDEQSNRLEAEEGEQNNSKSGRLLLFWSRKIQN